MNIHIEALKSNGNSVLTQQVASSAEDRFGTAISWVAEI